jgi:hypothetical protein
MSDGQQKPPQIERRPARGGGPVTPRPFPEQMAAFRERIIAMKEAGIDEFEPASIFQVRKD